MSPAHLDDERAQRYLDDLLPEPERARAEAHLASCVDCRLVLDGCRALAEALSGLPAALPPPDFTEAVLARVQERERTVSRERHVAAAVLGAAAAAAAVLVVVGGPAAWAPALSRFGAGLDLAVTWCRIGTDVAEPLLRALRLEIAAATAGAAIPLLYAMRRLSSRAATAAS